MPRKPVGDFSFDLLDAECKKGGVDFTIEEGVVHDNPKSIEVSSHNRVKHLSKHLDRLAEQAVKHNKSIRIFFHDPV